MKTNQIIIVSLLLIFVGGGAFFGGIKYQQSKKQVFTQFNGRNIQTPVQGQRQGNRPAGFSPISGEIISADDKSITVKLPDGSSKIVLFSDKTSINKAENATVNDLKTGEKIMIMGQNNSDGSVTAQNIQLSN